MSLLIAENPPETHPAFPLLDEVRGDWFVVQTLSRCEKRLAHALAQSEPALPQTTILPFYLPLLHCRNPKDRKLVLKPLFPGFVFVCTGPDPAAPTDAHLNLPDFGERAKAQAEAEQACRDTTYVFGFLRTKNQPRLRQELALLALETPAKRTLRVEPNTSSAGRALRGCRVRLRPGHACEGLEGTVDDSVHPYASPSSQKAGRPARFYVDMRLMGTVVSVEVPAADLEPI